MKQRNQKLRVAVIGTGYLGKFHAQKYADMKDVDLIGVVDIDRNLAQEVAAKFNTKAYTEYQEILDKVDAVSVVVPTSAHFAIAKDFLQQGVDVLIEKPMTNSLAEANELIRIAESEGRIIQVGHLERFNPAVVALRERDIIKRPLFIESHRLSLYPGRGTDVSVVLDLMIHDIDLILNFIGDAVTDIRAAGAAVVSEHADIANARLEFARGCVANVTASRISTKNERRIRIFQPDAYISVDFAKRNIIVIQREEDATEGPIPGMKIIQLDFNRTDALEDELKAFIKAVRRRDVPEVTGEMGREALKIALQIMDQIKAATKRILGR